MTPALPAELPPVEIIEAERIAVSAVELAALEIVIEDQAGLDQAAEFVREIATARKKVEEKFEKAREATHAAHKAVTSMIKELTDKLDSARKIVIPKIEDYQTAETRRQQEEADRLRKVAEQQAREAQAAKAKELADSGRPDLAEKVMDRPVALPPARKVEAPAAAGVSTRKEWTFEIENEAAIPDAFWCIDREKLHGLVKSMGPEAVSVCPGIRVVPKLITSVRSY